MPASLRLPRLRRDLGHERAVQTRLVLAHERALEAHLARVLTAASRRAAQAAHGGTQAAIAAMGNLEAELARALRASLVAVAQEFAHRLIASPKSASMLGASGADQHPRPFETKAFEDLDGAISRHMAGHTAEAVVGISETTREAIRRAVEAAMAENLGEEETAQAIVEATAGEIALARARRIARTEIHFAAMYGQQAAAEASPLEWEKVWLATEDSRTRESHAAANGQRVALSDTFVLEAPTGRVELRFPGDTSGPPGEIINCRCVCLFEPLPPGTTPRTRLPSPDLAELPAGIDVVDVPPSLPPLPEAEPVFERDLTEAPRERQTKIVYAAGDDLTTDAEAKPTVGQVVRLIGPNAFWDSADAPEVDGTINRLASGILRRPSTWLRRPVLWRVSIPAGAAFPPGLVDEAGAGLTINSGTGRFGLVALTVTHVTAAEWGSVVRKPYIDVHAPPYSDLDHPLASTLEEAIKLLEYSNFSLRDVLTFLDGQTDFGADLPPHVWARINNAVSKQRLGEFLVLLLNGGVRDEPGEDEPGSGTRVIIVDATADLAGAIVEPAQA